MGNLLKLILAVALLLTGAVASAQSMVITCSGNNCYLVNDNDGKLIIGTAEEQDIDICTDQKGTATCITIDDTTAGVALPSTITSSSATGIGWHVASGANTACNTTCANGGCVFGADTATDFDAVECDGATADICICAIDPS